MSPLRHFGATLAPQSPGLKLLQAAADVSVGILAFSRVNFPKVRVNALKEAPQAGHL